MTDIRRRTLMLGSATAAAGLLSTAEGMATPSKLPATRTLKGLPDVVVVGAGVFGMWSALCLQEKGAKVVVLDSYGPGNARQTSCDQTRQIRAAYGERDIYSRWSNEAFGLWERRQEEFGRRLLYPNGVVSTNTPAKLLEAQKRIFAQLDIPYEILSQAQLRSRWPQGRYDDVEEAFFEPRAGLVKARESTVAVAEAFLRRGGAIRLAKARLATQAGSRTAGLALSDGSRLDGGTLLFACGPWLPEAVPDIMAGMIQRQRREVFYFGSPAGDPSFHWERFPCFSDHDIAYSMSDIDYGYKIVPTFGTAVPIDPDTDERIVSPYQMDVARRYARQRVPALAGQPVVASAVCVIENSSDMHYIIDRHPELENVWIAGGGSGHAFKMAPRLGEYISDRLLGRADPEQERQLFSLKSHSKIRPYARDI